MSALSFPTIWTPRQPRKPWRAPRRWWKNPFHAMASGDVMLDDSGNRILNSDGSQMLDDGSGECCLFQARLCSDNTLAAMYVRKSQFPAFPATFYFYDTPSATCYYVQSSDTAPCTSTPIASPTTITDCSDASCSGGGGGGGPGISCTSCSDLINSVTVTVAGVTMASGFYSNGIDTSGGGVATDVKLNAGATANGTYNLSPNTPCFPPGAGTPGGNCNCNFAVAISGTLHARDMLGHCGAYATVFDESDTSEGVAALCFSGLSGGVPPAPISRTLQFEVVWINTGIVEGVVTAIGFGGSVTVNAPLPASCHGTYVITNQLVTIGLIPVVNPCPALGNDGGYGLLCTDNAFEELIAGTGGTATIVIA